MNNFEERCRKAGCVVVPVDWFSQSNSNGTLESTYYEGVFYTAVGFLAVGPKYNIEVLGFNNGTAGKHKTKEEALLAYEKELEFYE